MFRMFAGYNAWANRLLYEAAAGLDHGDYRADHGAFFGSVHRTLNHILVADRIWMRRFTGEGPNPTALDEIPFEEFAALRIAREEEDQRIIGWIETLSETDLHATFTYVPVTRPGEITQSLAPALSHVFNHQTHHRGQVHAILTRISGVAPSLDLILYQRQSGQGLT